MKKLWLISVMAVTGNLYCNSQAVNKSAVDAVIPVRGFCIAAPQSKEVDRFVKFIDEELAPRSVNTRPM